MWLRCLEVGVASCPLLLACNAGCDFIAWVSFGECVGNSVVLVAIFGFVWLADYVSLLFVGGGAVLFLWWVLSLLLVGFGWV